MASKMERMKAIEDKVDAVLLRIEALGILLAEILDAKDKAEQQVKTKAEPQKVAEPIDERTLRLKKLGANISMARKAKGMTQQDVAFAVGYKNGKNMSAVELGQTEIGIDRLAKIAEVLGVKLHDLMK